MPEENIAMDFKDKLKKLRTENGLTQEALADAVHISRSAIAKYENGNGKPSEDTLKSLAFYFGVEIKELESDAATLSKKKKKILKWSLVGAGSAVALAGVVVLILLLTIPYRSYNYSEINEPRGQVTGIIPHVFSKNEQGYEPMSNTELFADYKGESVPCFEASSGDDCYIAVSPNATGYSWKVAFQGDCIAFNESQSWSARYVEEKILFDAVTYRVHFEYTPTVAASIMEIQCTFQSFGASLYFRLN